MNQNSKYKLCYHGGPASNLSDPSESIVVLFHPDPDHSISYRDLPATAGSGCHSGYSTLYSPGVVAYLKLTSRPYSALTLVFV